MKTLKGMLFVLLAAMSLSIVEAAGEFVKGSTVRVYTDLGVYNCTAEPEVRASDGYNEDYGLFYSVNELYPTSTVDCTKPVGEFMSVYVTSPEGIGVKADCVFGLIPAFPSTFCKRNS